MNEYTRIYLPLSKDEFKALQERAIKECRHPKEQIRFMLRCALLNDNPLFLTKDNAGAVKVCETQAAAGIA
jgi:hypothetical protein